MKILKNEQIKILVYIEYTNIGTRKTVVKNGEILQISNLTSPMRGERSGLSDKEPHVTFYNGTEAVFIPVIDIIKINYV